MSTRTLAALAATLILGVSSAFAEEAESHHDGGEHGEPGHHAAAADDNDGGHHGDASHHGDGMAMMIGEPGNAADAARTVEISMVDNFFEPESLAFAAGETIRFVVTNDGSVVHEFNIGTA
ncbi:MAG: cupredoxin domain-containing protein, partial [Alphaproteobacteria bacterium]